LFKGIPKSHTLPQAF